jgi:cytochrome c oxidase subunit 1
MLNVLRSTRKVPDAGPNPWDSSTLEWATDSPPPRYNFVELPVVRSGHPLWDPPEKRCVAIGLRDDRREVLVTSLMDAEPQYRYVLPGPSIWPLVTTVLGSIGLLGSIFQFNFYYIGAVLTAIGLIGWFWPKKQQTEHL